MPSADPILQSLHEIAKAWRGLAVAWHVYFGALLAVLLMGARPGRRLFGALLALPLLSVSALAWSVGNPFNGIVFAALGFAALGVASRLSPAPVAIAPLWLAAPGALLFAFGWVYPHFLETTTALTYLYAAPTGLVPCPTLSAVTGLSLVGAGLGSSAWLLLLAAAGWLYGLIGAFHLDVTIDLALILGAALCLVAWRALRSRPG